MPVTIENQKRANGIIEKEVAVKDTLKPRNYRLNQRKYQSKEMDGETN